MHALLRAPLSTQGYKQPGSRINPADYFIDIVSGDIPGPGDPIDKGRRASFEILTDRHSFARESVSVVVGATTLHPATSSRSSPSFSPAHSSNPFPKAARSMTLKLVLLPSPPLRVDACPNHTPPLPPLAATLAAVDAVQSRAAGNADGGSGVEMSTLGSSTGAGAGAGSGAGAAGADSTATTGKDAKKGDGTAAAASADQPKPFFTTLPRLWHEHVKATVRRDAALASAVKPTCCPSLCVPFFCDTTTTSHIPPLQPQSSKSKRQSQVAQRGQTAMNVLRRASRVFVRAPVGMSNRHPSRWFVGGHLIDKASVLYAFALLASGVPASQAAGTGVALDPVVEAAAPPVMHERQMPGWFRQFFVFLVRSFTQQVSQAG